MSGQLPADAPERMVVIEQGSEAMQYLRECLTHGTADCRKISIRLHADGDVSFKFNEYVWSLPLQPHAYQIAGE